NLRERLSQLNSAAQENIAATRVMKAVAREEHEIEKFQEKIVNYSTANKKAALVWLDFFPFMETFSQAFAVILMVVGGLFVMNGRLTFGEFASVSALLWAIAYP